MRRPPVRERDFQRQVIAAAKALGWRVAHFRPARTLDGWRTPVTADGAGWPDLVLVRGSAMLIRELKSDRGRLTHVQRAWLDALELAGVDVGVWRPRDWSVIEMTLKTRQ